MAQPGSRNRHGFIAWLEENGRDGRRYFFVFARGIAISRAASIKSCATGEIILFFSVTMPIGSTPIGGATGKTLMSGR
jgi:hypothetical protein